MDAVLVQGSPQMLDYTPVADVDAGAVVVIGDVVRIAHRDIPANTLGALAAEGGVYRCAKATGVGTAIADGKRVYWKAADSTITETAGTDKMFGYAAEAAGDDDETILVRHHPPVYGPDATS